METPMVEIRVSIEDATQASTLMRRLARLFEVSSISFDQSRSEVRVESEWESRAVAGVVEVVEAWLEDSGVESATVSIGDRTHALGAATPLAAIR
jgi:hypothetical protein